MLIEPVDITPAAYQAISEIMSKKSVSKDYGLRIYVSDSGISCGATNYALGFDKETDTDIIYSKDSLKVIVKKAEVVHLAGLKLDYTTEDNVTGFLFSR